jgi:SAM-dependent methyltransferase
MIDRLARLVPRRLRRDVKGWLGDRSREATEPRTAALEARVSELEARLAGGLADLDTSLQQVLALLRREAQVAPLPPKHLQERVVGKFVPGFPESGYELCRELDEALVPAGKTLGDFPRILDFGCGSGRVTRALKTLHPQVQVSGTDIDPEAIGWLAGNYAKYGAIAVAPHRPPTSYPDAAFDFIFGISVFTHLPQDMEAQWLDELRRIAAPGAHLVLTTHGQSHWSQLAPEVRTIVERDGFYYGDFGWNYGRSISLPDFYQTAYHSPDYVRREWGKRFDVLAITPLGMGKHQDTVLLRRPA